MTPLPVVFERQVGDREIVLTQQLYNWRLTIGAAGSMFLDDGW